MWRTMFGKPADSLERVTDKDDECPAHPLRFYPHTARNVRRSPSAARASSTLRHHRGGCGRHDPRQGAASQRLHLGAPRLRQPQLRRLRRRRRPRHARRGSPSPTAGRTGSPGPLTTTSLAPANPPPRPLDPYRCRRRCRRRRPRQAHSHRRRPLLWTR